MPIQLIPHGSESYIVLEDGKSKGAFWYQEERGGEHHFTPVFPQGGHQPFSTQGHIEILPRRTG